MPNRVSFSRHLALVLLSVASLAISASAHAACPPIPGPPRTSDPYAGRAPTAPVQVTGTLRTDVPNGTASYCLYTPPTAAAPAGVVLYIHGAQLFEEGSVDPMLQFLAQAGYYIVYPYATDFARYPSQSRGALSHALTYLSQRGVAAQRVAVAGYSLGGIAAARVAATWNRTPAISAIILHDPAGMDFLPFINLYGEWDVSASGLRTIPCSTRLLIVQAQSSVGVTSSAALTLWNNLPQIARYVGSSGTTSRRNFLRVRDDVSHALRPPFVTLASNHEVPNAFPITSMDFYGYWLPLFGGVFEAFTGTPFWGWSPYCNTSSTTGTCAATRSMSNWVLDGVAATPMQNAADLGLLQGFPNYCSP